MENEYVPADILTAVRAVVGLRKGKAPARETKPIQLVADEVVEQTLPRLSPVVADMVRLQRLTGMRPTEVYIVRPCDLDCSQGEAIVEADTNPKRKRVAKLRQFHAYASG